MATAVVSRISRDNTPNLKGAYGTGKNNKGMEWTEAMTLFVRSRRLGLYGARRQARERTITEYHYDLGKFFNYVKSVKKITHYNQLTRTDVLDYIEWVNDQGWAKASKKKFLKSLKSFFVWVDKDPDCKANKMVGFVTDIPRLEQPPGRQYIPTPEVMYSFLNSFDQDVRWGLRDYTVMTLLLDTGLRNNEVCNLKESHFKFDAAMLMVPEEGKTGERLIPIDRTTTIPIIKRWMRERERFAKCDRMFLNRFGGPCNPHTFDQTFKYQRNKTGLGIDEHGNLSPHTVRHFFCTYYLVNGGTLHNLQRITGHKSLQTLMIYVHLAKLISSVTEEHSRVSPMVNLMKTAGVAKKKRKVV